MIREEIGTGRTVEAAIANGAEKLGVDAARIQYDIIEAPKKGFLGFGEAPAKVRVYVEIGPEQTALDYLNNVLNAMEMYATSATLGRELNSEGGKIIKIAGGDTGVLIGRHGETLDALQYLSNLALNNELEKTGGECAKISVDIEGYRARREETLRNLAKRTADKVKRFKRNIALDPMTPYERRIIHAALQNDPQVMTASVGSDEHRKVVIHYVGAKRTQKPKKEEKEIPEQVEE
jgi:spoIIIJ-associated protein